MAVPEEITELIHRLNRELSDLENITTESLTIARNILKSYPENQILIQMFAFLNSVLFLVETERQRIQQILDTIFLLSNLNNQQIQSIGEDLSYKLGQIIETQFRVNAIKQRLENLQ